MLNCNAMTTIVFTRESGIPARRQYENSPNIILLNRYLEKGFQTHK
jgi:hypothetical protein